ncbi:protein FAM111A-like [Archocentrus centrarchus]|uniref:protein FAM111A-like n=1 Tax=Archocentrus centrarchus TaxID=63155 RepID=UPI0011EA0E95|nr:protein FAM111A-like [Archocentrus centrarchus]
MAPKKQQKTTEDIGPYLEKKNDSPGSSSRGSSLPEGASTSQDPHKHRFMVEFSPGDNYTINCDQPRTVLEAITALTAYKTKIKCKDNNVIIKMGAGDNESVVATHFPCSCLGDDEVLTISCTKKVVENAKDIEEVLPKAYYSVFYIETKGGKNLTSAHFFKNNKVEKFKYVCVYGKIGITVEEALKRDGRFIDDLRDFELINNINNSKTECKDRIDDHVVGNQKFKICRSRQNETETKNVTQKANLKQQKQQKPPNASTNSQHKTETSSVLAVAQQKGINVKNAMNSDNRDEIYKILRKQFPELKQWMESRFSGSSYKDALKLRKENFGKIQQSFSEVHRVKKLLELGKSVCKICVKAVSTGTGFVLFDTFILTNAHLFTGYFEGKKLQQDIEVYAIFDYEEQEPEPETEIFSFRAENRFIDFDAELDYAVLELNPEGSQPNQQTEAKNITVPTGLLSKFGPLPPNGEACIIGHPAGGVKQMDPTCIIETKNRGSAIDEHLLQYKEPLIIQLISDLIRKQGIENILIGGSKAGVSTYHTFMYHGASGSPVFDGLGKVFGLHTAGYVYGFTKARESVIEYAHPLIVIFEKFVSNLKDSGNEELLKRVQEAAEGNELLTEVLEREQEGEQPMDISE